jgi:hypothetical protein
MKQNVATHWSFNMQDFDPAKLKLNPNCIPSGPPAKKRTQRSKSQFVKLPMIWLESLAGIKASASTYRVAAHLLHEAWKSGERVIKLPNEALAKKGVGREGKAIALRELRKAGLVAVEERPRKSPLVTVRFTDQ